MQGLRHARDVGTDGLQNATINAPVEAEDHMVDVLLIVKLRIMTFLMRTHFHRTNASLAV